MAGAPRRSRALVLPPFKTDLLSRDFSRRRVPTSYPQPCLRIHPIPKPTSLWCACIGASLIVKERVIRFVSASVLLME